MSFYLNDFKNHLSTLKKQAEKQGPMDYTEPVRPHEQSMSLEEAYASMRGRSLLNEQRRRPHYNPDGGGPWQDGGPDGGPDGIPPISTWNKTGFQNRQPNNFTTSGRGNPVLAPPSTWNKTGFQNRQPNNFTTSGRGNPVLAPPSTWPGGPGGPIVDPSWTRPTLNTSMRKPRYKPDHRPFNKHGVDNRQPGPVSDWLPPPWTRPTLNTSMRKPRYKPDHRPFNKHGVDNRQPGPVSDWLPPPWTRPTLNTSMRKPPYKPGHGPGPNSGKYDFGLGTPSTTPGFPSGK